MATDPLFTPLSTPHSTWEGEAKISRITISRQKAEIDGLRTAANVMAVAARTLIDNYGFSPDGSDNYREVKTEDLKRLEDALIKYAETIKWPLTP